MIKVTLLGMLIPSALFAGSISREALYDCAYMKDDSFVETLTVYHSTQGRREFHEVLVRANVAGEYRESFKRVNLVSTYEGRIQTFGTGNFRVKINRVFPQEGKYRTFVRIPQYDMHSSDWTCKDAY